MTLPVALDSNVLVRLLVNDDPVQAQQAAALIDSSAACFVPITVVLELEWVLRGACKLQREAVIAAFEGLLAIRHLHLEQDDRVRQALEAHREAFVRSVRRSPNGLTRSPNRRRTRQLAGA